MVGIILTLVAVLITLSFAFYTGYAEGEDRSGRRGPAAANDKSRSSTKER